MGYKSIQSQTGSKKYNTLIARSNNLADKNPNARREEEAVQRRVPLPFKLELVIRIRVRWIYIVTRAKLRSLIRISCQMDKMDLSMRKMISI